MNSSFLRVVLSGALLAFGIGLSAQTVPVTLAVRSPKGAPLGHASIGIATGPNEPFSFYPGDARGDVKLSLAPGVHELRLFARGYPMTWVRLDVTVPGRVAIVLGRGTASSPASAQTQSAYPSRAPARAAHPRAPALRESPLPPGANPLDAYTSCSFPDLLRIVSVKPIAPGPLLVATPQGTQTIETETGEEVMFSYPLTDFFAQAKVERFPADQYAHSRQVLLSNLHFMESLRNGPAPAEALPAGLHGLEVHGNNRSSLEGDVLGMYLVFDDSRDVVATISFLNQHSWQRKFQTMQEYEALRDRFLRNYTACIRQNQAIVK